MEKRSAHYKLADIKSVVRTAGADAFTFTALNSIYSMGLSIEEAMGVALSLTEKMLYKSMTTYADHTIWQDVYHAPCPNGKTAYIKVTKQDGAVVIQFKEK